ncbi:MAG: L,D-transpeptidase [Candidatus Magasanikbacteria bacterium]|nr:L,D-transpeptidase [Candidatus Magasanikbacteria bacterium]
MKRFIFLLLLFIFFFALFFLAPALAQETINTDSDNDGLTDEQEIFIYHTDPNNSDTDCDGYKDGAEVENDYSPLVKFEKMFTADFDKDGLVDGAEINLGTDPTNPDSDGDGYFDGLEVEKGYDPLNPAPVRLEKEIKVSLKEQKLTYFLGGKKINEFLISSGIARLPTPQGEFKILQKKPIVHYQGLGYDLPNTKWNLAFTKNGKGITYFIHGAYWHNKFGQPMSHGCVNVAYKNMEPLYNWAQVGTKVVIK